MSATIVTQLEVIRRELRNTRRTAHVESCRRNARRALRQIEQLERVEDSLEHVCECGLVSCRGHYKPDGSHELAF